MARHVEQLERIFAICGKDNKFDTLGKNVDELQQLSEKGELGGITKLYGWGDGVYTITLDLAVGEKCLVSEFGGLVKDEIKDIENRFCWVSTTDGVEKIYFDSETVEVGDNGWYGDLIEGKKVNVTSIFQDVVMVSGSTTGSFQRNKSFDTFIINGLARNSILDIDLTRL